MLKKCIVAFDIALNILLCKFVEAFIKNDTNTAHLTKDTIIKENIRIEKTIMHVLRETEDISNSWYELFDVLLYAKLFLSLCK